MHSFTKIKGRDKLINSLLSQLAEGSVSHATIFSGERGIGKKTLGYALAKALLCENKNACGHCKACITFESGNNPDFTRIAPDDKASVGVEEIREKIIATVYIKPFLYKKKVYLIEEACKLTTQAQNALLKTLEEAGKYAVFILLCENDALMLSTVLSRCRVIKLRNLSLTDTAKLLEERLSLSPEDAAFYASLASGNPGLALELAASESFTKLRRFVVYDILDNLHRRGLPELFRLAKALEEYKDEINKVFDIMLLWYRDLAVYTELGRERLIQHDLLGLLEHNDISAETLALKAEIISGTKKRLERNTSFLLTIENMLIKLAG